MYALTLTAEMSGVTDLQPDDSEESPFYYMFQVECTSCREVHPNRVGISRFESNELSGSRGEANFVWRCKNCKRESSASIVSGPTPYTISSPPTQQKILTFECRGCELSEFRSEGEWIVTGEKSGTKFVGVDLGEGEWYECDEKTAGEVSIKEIKWEIKRA